MRDYSRNDRVGKSYIEQQYEDVLHGTKKVEALLINKEILLERKRFRKGKAVKLALTIDMELQKSRGEHRKILKQYKGSESMLDRAFVVMMNPKMANIINGWEKACRKDGKMEVEDYALGTLTSSYELGSTVKVRQC